MARRKITEEAQEQTDDQPSDDGEREKLTQRMPESLVEDVDDYSNRYGLSRNAAINMLVRRGLQEDQ
jgi:hypothetical protein